MLRIVAGLLLIAHGLVHLLYFAPRPEDDRNYPFVPEDRWFAKIVGLQPGAAKAVAGTLAVTCMLLLVVSGISLLAKADLWTPTAVAGSLISMFLMLLFFHPWLGFGLAIDVAILASVWSQVPVSIYRAEG